MQGVEPLLLDRPCGSCIATHAKPHRRRSYHDLGPRWMCTDLMNIAMDIDRGLPGQSGIGGSRNSANMDVGQKHAIACRRHGTNSQRRPYPLAVDDCEPCIPRVAAGYAVKTRQPLLRAVRSNAQDTCVVGSNKNNFSN